MARPGGGESDAAFTPSPPVVQNEENRAMAMIAHQTRIRNLYSQNDGKPHRPDSSSSASSATDWDNGHATVLRRGTVQPPVPPPRTKPLVDLPVIPLYNNLPPGVFENSSDSELEKMEAKLFSVARSKGKKSRNPMSTLDRLSVRTEVTPAQPQTTSRKMAPLANDENTNERLLYFAPNDSDPATKSDAAEESVHQETSVFDTKNTNTLHDTILATQLRHINRELTPTISDVYLERNLGLGLAPPLAKLLLNGQTSQSTPQTDNSVLEKITLGILEENELVAESKPWMSENALQQIQSSDLTTADILEREVKNKKKKEEGEGVFTERRDEGDGRSIADSSSSSYKGTQFRSYKTNQGRIKGTTQIRGKQS